MPMVGFELGDVVFALPFIVLIFAATRCVLATRRGTGLRWTWRSLAVGAVLEAVASAIALVTAMGDVDGTSAFYVGAAASLAMVVAVGPLGRRSLRRLPVATAIDCALVGLPVLALGVYLVALSGAAGTARD